MQVPRWGAGQTPPTPILLSQGPGGLQPLPHGMGLEALCLLSFVPESPDDST